MILIPGSFSILQICILFQLRKGRSLSWQQGGLGMAAIFGPVRTDYSAVGSPGGPLSRGDCPRRDTVPYLLNLTTYGHETCTIGYNKD